jgi:hypothetical protein
MGLAVSVATDEAKPTEDHMQKAVSYEAKRTKDTPFEKLCDAPFVVVIVTETTYLKNGKPKCAVRTQSFAYTMSMQMAKRLADVMNAQGDVEQAFPYIEPAQAVVNALVESGVALPQHPVLAGSDPGDDPDNPGY